MSAELFVTLFMALLVKHFLCEFVFRYPYQYENEHVYGHMGGISHSLIHVFGTFFVLTTLVGGTHDPHLILSIVVAEFIVHYHIDWMTGNMIHHYKKQPTGRLNEIWWIAGMDHLLHYATYYAIVLTVLRYNTMQSIMV